MLNKTAIVTGSTGGIGKAICQSFHDEGINVIGVSHAPDETTAWKNYACDLADVNTLENNFNKICEAHGATANILINNAGVYHAKAWTDLSVLEFEQAMSVNTTAPFILIRAWANKLIEQKQSGVCVNVSSVSAHLGSVDVSYAASKAGVNLVTKTMAKALATHDIRVNGIAPGPIKTKMADRIPLDRQEKYKENIPMQRFGDVKEIASLVRFLTNDQSSFITGETINIDGGLS